MMIVIIADKQSWKWSNFLKLSTSNLKMWVSNPWNLLESCGHPTPRKDDLNFGAAADVVGVPCGRGLRRLNSEIPRKILQPRSVFSPFKDLRLPSYIPPFFSCVQPPKPIDVHSGKMDQSSTGATNTRQKHLVDRALLPAADQPKGCRKINTASQRKAF